MRTLERRILALEVTRIAAEAFPSIAEMVPENEGGCQGGVAAKIDLQGGGEPAEMKATLPGHQEGSFRKVVLRRDRLHGFLGQPFLQGTDGCRIARKPFAGECIDLENGDLHGLGASRDGEDPTGHFSREKFSTIVECLLFFE